jgi:hypothetical protein
VVGDARAAGRVGEPGRVVEQAGHGGQQHAGPGDDQLAERRGPDTAVVPVEQRAAEGPLDPAQLGGQRRLGDTQLGSGLRDAPGVSDGTHDPKVPQLQLHSVSLPAFPGRHVPLSARG